jgi:hypothetical protein
MSFNGARHEMEVRADFARDRLLDTISAIDRRRHEVLDWKLQLRQHLAQLAMMSAVVVGAMGLLVGVGLYRAKLFAERRRGERVRALGRFWQHPERVATRQRRRPLRATLLSGFITLLTLAATRIARRRS